MNIFWYPFLGSTAHALLCYLPPGHYCACSQLRNKICFNFNAQTPRCASASHVQTVHKLAANSSGPSHRLTPLLDPNHVSGRIFFVIRHCGLRSCSSWMCLHRPDDYIASTQPWCGCFREFLQSDWISINFLIKIWAMCQITSCSSAAASRTLGHVIQSVHCRDYVAEQIQIFLFVLNW